MNDGIPTVPRAYVPRRSAFAVRIAVPRVPRRRLWIVGGLVLLAVVVLLGTGYDTRAVAPSDIRAVVPEDAASAPVSKLRAENRKLTSYLDRLAPRGTYIVVDRTNNRLYLRDGDEVRVDAACSAGSGALLKDTDRDRQWVFDTPTGRFRVQKKIEDPVWKKPDWAFIEIGEPVPRDPNDRFEYGTLGEYALYLGDGYMIHGTLYERLLGRAVTHGCVRLGRDDLRKVYAAARVGTPVYIY